MSNIPLHVQRRFEQRWASRFTRPAAANAPKNVGTKARTVIGSAAAARIKEEKPACVNRWASIIIGRTRRLAGNA
jgi:hypothetical protein